MWLIGSRAAERHIRLPRRPADIDLMCTPEEAYEIERRATSIRRSEKDPGKFSCAINRTIIEVDSTDNESRLMMSEAEAMLRQDGYMPSDRTASGIYHEQLELPDVGLTVLVPKLSTLWAFKRSHAGYPLFPDKTLADLIRLSTRVIGTKQEDTNYEEFLLPFEIELLKQLRSEVKARFERRDRRMTFDRPAKDFFKSAQNIRTYEHDSLHDATHRYECGPLYRQMLVDPEKALVDMNRFMSQSLEYRMTMAQEEAIVIGLERFYIKDRNLSADAIYRKGMTKMVFDLCKGRFQDFVLDHIHLMTKPLWDFKTKFDEAEAAGRLYIIENDKTNTARD